MIDTYQADGVVLVKGLFADHVDQLRDGVAANMADPGPYASENKKAGETGRFFDDYCNWTRIPQFRDVIETSPAAEVAADLMQSQTRSDVSRSRAGQGTRYVDGDTVASGRPILFRRGSANDQLLVSA